MECKVNARRNPGERKEIRGRFPGTETRRSQVEDKKRTRRVGHDREQGQEQAATRSVGVTRSQNTMGQTLTWPVQAGLSIEIMVYEGSDTESSSPGVNSEFRKSPLSAMSLRTTTRSREVADCAVATNPRRPLPPTRLPLITSEEICKRDRWR